MRCLGGLPRVLCPTKHQPLIRYRNSSVDRRRCVRRWVSAVPGWLHSGDGGNGGMGGNGDDGGDDFFANDDGGDSFPMKLNLFAAMSLFAHDAPEKQNPFALIAETTEIEAEEEDEMVEEEGEEAEEEEEEMYVKPPPKPRAESINYKAHASWMLLLLVLSGGLFLWRKARNRPPTYEAEEDEAVLVQRTRDIPIDALGECNLQSLPEEVPEDGGQNSGVPAEESRKSPDFVQALEEQDALFDVDREVSVERQLSGVERSLSVEEDEALSKEPDSSAVVPPPETPTFAVSEPSKAFQTTDAPSAEMFVQDLDDKDVLFRDERMTEPKEPVTGPLTPPPSSPSLVRVQFIVNDDKHNSVQLELSYDESTEQHQNENKALETGVSERSLMSPLTSQTDEGSNQSSSTHLSEDGILNEGLDAMSPPAIIAEEEDDQEEFDFDKQPPIKCPMIDEDLGPPIKPVAIDFTKPSPWEEDLNSKGIGKSTTMMMPELTDERMHTMQYLMSNADLLTEALKRMESGSTLPSATSASAFASIPDAPKSMPTKNGASKKKKKRRGKTNSSKQLQ